MKWKHSISHCVDYEKLLKDYLKYFKLFFIYWEEINALNIVRVRCRKQNGRQVFRVLGK